MPEINGHVILLIIFVVISAVKWLIEKIKTSDETWEGEEPPGAIENIYEQYREEIRNRQTKLKQKKRAQQMQRAETPPQQAQTPPPLPPIQSQRSEPDHWTPPPGPKPLVQPAVQRIEPTPTYKPRKTVVTAEQQAAASRFAQRSISPRQPSAQQYVRKLLSSPQSTRQAIILAEILGKPKSLQNG